MSEDITTQTAKVLQHHLQSIGESNIDAIVSDYGEESVLYTPSGPIKGTKNLHDFFTGFLASMPEFMKTFAMIRQDVVGENAYICWKAPQYTPLGTDTFVIRNGKILVQTFAAYIPE